ncbi:MAG TPA: DUF420 domain-containing protein [Planctomycetota bacterium]|nr:DUF420 domain-containing protein [Planctomycetota bacterium]
MEVKDLPALNASLNGLATVLLALGYIFIKRKNIEAHRNLMVAAGLTSAAFLVSYLIYHFNVVSMPFKGQGNIRYVYFAILISHILLAMVIAVLVPKTFWHAYRQDYEKHRKVARVTFPLWMYVSITGVVIYVMLYHLYAASGA